MERPMRAILVTLMVVLLALPAYAQRGGHGKRSRHAGERHDPSVIARSS